MMFGDGDGMRWRWCRRGAAVDFVTVKLATEALGLRCTAAESEMIHPGKEFRAVTIPWCHSIHIVCYFTLCYFHFIYSGVFTFYIRYILRSCRWHEQRSGKPHGANVSCIGYSKAYWFWRTGHKAARQICHSKWSVKNAAAVGRRRSVRGLQRSVSWNLLITKSPYTLHELQRTIQRTSQSLSIGSILSMEFYRYLSQIIVCSLCFCMNGTCWSWPFIDGIV